MENKDKALNPEEQQQAVDEFTEVLKDEYPEGSLLEQCLNRRNMLEQQNFQMQMKQRNEALGQLKENLKVDPEVMRRMGIKYEK